MFRQPTPEQREAQRAASKAANLEALCIPARTLHTASMAGGVRAVVAKVAPKVERKVNQAIRDSAKGEACLVRIPGCPGDPAMTIWSHARWNSAGKGKSTKALDISGAFACTYCDSIFDGQTPPPPGYTREQVDADWCQGHFRSLMRLAEKGLL